MAHGAPDWSNILKQGVVYRIDDMAELAARLGSIATFDRRGEVVLLDNFEATCLHGQQASSGGVPAITLSNTYARSGSQSLKVVTTGVIDQYAGVAYEIAYLAQGKAGVEAHVILDAVNASWVEIFMSITVGGVNYQGRVRYYLGTKIVRVQNPDLSWTTVQSNVWPGALLYTFLPMKMVVDVDTGLYTRAIVGGQAIDLSSYSMLSQVLNRSSYIWTYVAVASAAAAPATCYIDDVIITQNEP